jgi:hypothetical protein
MANDIGTTLVEQEIRCAECSTPLAEGQDRETAGDVTFCRSCFNNAQAQFEQSVQEQGTDVNYPMGFLGGLLGGAVGVLAWWGFTVLTEIEFGLVAVVIGFAVGKGVTLFAGEKRSQGLQVMSILLAGLSFFYASYLVNRSFLMQAFLAEGEAVVLPLLPSPQLLYNVVSIQFGLFEVLFLGFALWEAWKIPAPIKLTTKR